MGPSKKKVSKKAAALRQWKVGDLVLAKVKGFPPWPATVSEPEAWGYKPDQKKVLVYFFGTKEIAFCNPIEIEPFTEEKKVSLLVKRPGRSADFLKAAQEIAVCFEKLKEQPVDKLYSGEAPPEDPTVSCADVKNSVLSAETPNSRLNSPGFVNGKTEQISGIEYGSKELEASQYNMNPEEPSKEILNPDSPDKTLQTIKRASKTKGSQPQCLKQAKSSGQRSRTSLKFDYRYIENVSGSSHDCNNGVKEGPRNGYLDRSMGRHKKKKKSFDPLVQGVGESMLYNSNGVAHDTSSEASMADSDAFSNYEDNTMHCKTGRSHSEHPNNSDQRDTTFSKGLGFDMKTEVCRKKRKPGRKRVASDMVESVAAPPDLEIIKNRQSSLPTERDYADRNTKEDGDEHLPLVKRARVRMGKTSVDEQFDVLIEREEKPSETSANMLQVNATIEFAADNGPEKCSLNAMDSSVYSSPSDGSPTVQEEKPLVWKARKGKSLSCSYDGEAALPPSKRLHRALEAMSANAAEEGLPSVVASLCMKEETDGCNNVSKNSPQKILKPKEYQLKHEESTNCNGASCIDATSIVSSSLEQPPSIEGHVLVDSNMSNALVEDTTDKNNVHKEDKEEEVVCPPAKVYRDPDHVVGVSHSEHGVSCPSKLLDNTDGLKSNLVLDQCVSNQFLVEGKKEVNCFAEMRSSTTKVHIGFETAKLEIRSDPTSGDEAVERNRGQDGILFSQCCKETKNFIPVDILKPVSEVTGGFQDLEPSTEETLQVASMCETVKESVHLPAVVKLSSPVLDVTTSPRISCLTSVSAAKLMDQAVSNSQLVRDVSRMVSPPCTIAIAPDSCNVLQYNDDCMPDVGFGGEKHAFDRDENSKYNSEVSKSLKSSNKSGNSTDSSSKSSNCADLKATLASFETNLKLLTRAKESISKATRLAIDCAKFGSASEVVETLARHLEKESILHRRIDLFFLVDSIAQHSRGLKGSICDAYTSAIQAALPRLLSAAAPSGYGARENRRQCRKVLKLWQERRYLPESIINQQIRDIDSHGSSSSAGGGFSRRMSRTERSFDDPIREMEGMNVDEYGSNSTFQIPGFCMPRMVRIEDDGSDSDGGSYEAVTPEHETNISGRGDVSDLPSVEKHRHILEDVDGELEMEDASPSCEAETRHSLNPTKSDAHITDLAEQNTPFFVPPLPPPVPPLFKSPPPPPPPMSTVLPPPPPMGLAPLPQPPRPLLLQPHPPPLPPMPLPPPPPPPSPPPIMHPSAMSHAGNDSHDHTKRHNVQEGTPVYHPAPRATASQMQMTDSSPSCSYNSYSHNSVRPGNDSYHGDSAYHNNAYHLRPPNAAPSNQFSYFQAEQRGGPHREPPMPSYGDWSRFPPTTENAHFHGDRERARSGAYEYADDWRYSRPSYNGPHHSDKSRGYPPSCSHPSRDSGRAHNPGWDNRPRPMHHSRYHSSSRNYPEGPPPTVSRAPPPGFWPPR